MTISNVTVSNHTKSGSGVGGEGMYFEALSNAELSGITATNNVAQSVELNLKFDDYENVSISDSTITGTNGTGLFIQARDGAFNPDFGNPAASLTNVDLSGLNITGNNGGITIGQAVDDVDVKGSRSSTTRTIRPVYLTKRKTSASSPTPTRIPSR